MALLPYFYEDAQKFADAGSAEGVRQQNIRITSMSITVGGALLTMLVTRVR
eukprot:CAMPEP_0117604362 /NCGR_PEP_ID=MMETSP0784-20121206/78640_1 /TAXON_ID=39447 /ORGANISM="" /LENGTH=50 /DNA_ID=CAMNT_0005407375 /DNA_START=78 /DNA_END=227 /DNA_ORIENTATION=-